MARGGLITLTASGVVGDSAKAQRLYGAAITSDSTAGVTILYSGTGTGGTKVLELDGTISKSLLIANFPAEGVLFPGGLYASLDAHSTSVSFMVEQVTTT